MSDGEKRGFELDKVVLLGGLKVASDKAKRDDIFETKEEFVEGIHREIVKEMSDGVNLSIFTDIVVD